jgi:hypothetical protein
LRQRGSDGRGEVCDAADEHAAAFYEKYGFQRIPDTDPIRLHQRLSDIAAALEINKE